MHISRSDSVIDTIPAIHRGHVRRASVCTTRTKPRFCLNIRKLLDILREWFTLSSKNGILSDIRLSAALFKCISYNTPEKLSQTTKRDINQRFSNGFRKIVVCENCLYYASISEFYSAHRYCLECLCDHACCPVCNISYHAINISEWPPSAITPPDPFWCMLEFAQMVEYHQLNNHKV